MPLEKLLATSARLGWRDRSWWVLGLAATAGGLLLSLVARGLIRYAAIHLSSSNLKLQDVLEQLVQPDTIGLGAAMLLVLALVAWLAGAVMEGGLITVVMRRAPGEAISLSTAIRSGARLLGRFIAIDTLLFLPLFLLALALAAVSFAMLAGLALVVAQPAVGPADLFIVAGLGTAAAVPLLLLMLTVAFVTFLLRSLSFRAVALENLAPAASIRRGWMVMRRKPLAVTVLALVLMAIRSAAGLPLRLASLILAGLALRQTALALAGTGFTGSGATHLVIAAGLLLSLLSWLVSGLMNAYSSTAWTLSYETWVPEVD